ncbi:MAG: serine/threonine protein kinase, partial [Chitinophagaceae bacterium]
YNVQTGNYVLLDFGMAIMSDEQRRTSLRHAGAIEFMAPEQNEGQILFQTDIYSFGVILFELLAGTVPFPLNERGETARTQVMLAHMETAPPDLLALRRQHLPEGWSEEKKPRELQVPQWLVDTVYICLQKDPRQRFAEGVMLHDHIVLRSTQKSQDGAPVVAAAAPVNAALEAEVARLRSENEQLLRRLQSLQERPAAPASTRMDEPEPAPVIDYPRRRRSPNLLPLFLVLGVLGVAAWLVIGKPGIDARKKENTVPAPVEANLVAGQYMVKANRAYFYDEPDADKRRSAYMVPSSDVVTTTRETNGFVYTDFTNDRGQRSKGWLRKRDLMTLDEWNAQQQQRQQEATPELTPDAINRQLADARGKLDGGQLQEALYLYKFLSDKNVPEAQFEYGNLALQGRHSDINCGQAIELVMKASDSGYVPAKRTMGFLYVFADNPDALSSSGYQHCSYERNVYKGTNLLQEAANQGDEAARKLVDQLQPGTSTDRRDSQ